MCIPQNMDRYIYIYIIIYIHNGFDPSPHGCLSKASLKQWCGAWSVFFRASACRLARGIPAISGAIVCGIAFALAVGAAGAAGAAGASGAGAAGGAAAGAVAGAAGAGAAGGAAAVFGMAVDAPGRVGTGSAGGFAAAGDFPCCWQLAKYSARSCE